MDIKSSSICSILWGIKWALGGTGGTSIYSTLEGAKWVLGGTDGT
jgi:hypothetical protein